jgi:replicative DNA helicase
LSNDTQQLRVPPQDPEAEEAILAAMFMSKDVIRVAGVRLRADHFYRESHGALFNLMLTMEMEGVPVDAITLHSEATKAGIYEKIGGLTTISRLMDGPFLPANAEYYIDTVLAKAAFRKAIHACATATAELYEEERTPADVIAELMDQFTSGSDVIPDDDISASTMRELSALQDFHTGKNTYYISSGFFGWDQTFGGWERGKLTVICGAPKNGKSLLSINSTLQMAAAGVPVAYIFLDERKRQIIRQFLCNMLRVDMKTLTTGDRLRVPKDLQDAGKFLASLPIHLVDEDDVTKSLDRILLWLRRAKQKHNIQVAFLDSFSILDFFPTKDKNMERVVAEAANKLVSAAGALDIALVVISEVARDEEGALRAKYSGRIEGACYIKYEVRRQVDDKTKEFTDVMMVKAALHRGNRYGTCQFTGNGNQFRIKNFGNDSIGGYGDRNVFQPKKQKEPIDE